MKEILELALEEITPKDTRRLLEATKAELPFQNTGLTKEEWAKYFGEIPPNSLARLFILSGEKIPRSRKGWIRFGEKVLQNKMSLER